MSRGRSSAQATTTREASRAAFAALQLRVTRDPAGAIADHDEAARGRPQAGGEASSRGYADLPMLRCPVQRVLRSFISLPTGLSFPHPDGTPVWFGPNRRKAKRVKALRLNEGDVAYLLRTRERVAQCSTRFKVYAKLDTRPSSLVDGAPAPGARQEIVERRLTFRLPCGLRQCPRCFKDNLQERQRRVVGGWAQAWVLTLDQKAMTMDGAWERCSGWVSEFFRRFGKRYAHRPEDAVKRCRPGYAWVIERHKSGYPHIHFVTDRRWVSHAWVLRMWREITGTERAFIRFKPVFDSGRLARYLAKYLAKQDLTEDIFAVMRTKRLFASTLPAKSLTEGGWTQAGKTDAASLQLETWAAEERAYTGEWQPEWWVDGEGIEWIRSLGLLGGDAQAGERRPDD